MIWPIRVDHTNFSSGFKTHQSERLNAITEGSTRLTYTGLRRGLEHLKIETRLIDERFESVMGECVI